MDLSRFPRRRYSQGPSPIEFLPNFTKALGGPRVWIKRDDMLGLAPGGNKTRKLEFLMGDALTKMPTDKQIVLHCKVGGRSAEVLAAVKGAGFKDAIHVGGGILAWVSQIEPDKPSY